MKFTRHNANNNLEAKYGLFLHRSMYKNLNGFTLVLYWNCWIYRVEF